MNLPTNWSSKRLKYLATYNDEVLSEKTSEEKEINYVEISGVSFSRGIEEIECLEFGKAPSRARRIVKRGDIIVSTVRTYLKAIAKVDEVLPSMIVSTGFCVIRPNEDIDNKFLGWACQSELFVSEVVSRSYGVSYPAIAASELVKIGMPLPLLDTQRQITRFLDEKTERLDALIEKKHMLLERLTEKRQALITSVVTGNLNLTEPAKADKGRKHQTQREYYMTAEEASSMILGRSHQGQRLKWVFSSCKNGTWGTEPDGHGDVICIRAADFDEQFGRLKDGERTLRSVDAYTFDKLALQPGDIIIEKSGGGEKRVVGRAVIFEDDEPSVTSNFLARCRVVPDVNPRFINYLLLAIYNVRGTYPHLKQTTGIQNLDLASFLNARVTIPTISKQLRIAQFLDKNTAQIDEQSRLIEHSISLLFEYRAALITAATTGQISGLQ